MSASELIKNQIAMALKSNGIYTDNVKRWQFLFESYVGGTDYRNGRHLKRYQLETDDEYAKRLNNTPLENHCQNVISIYNSFLFRQPPARDYGNVANLEDTYDFLNDSDFEGRHLDAVMKEVSTWSSVFGHCWIMMCKPNVGAQTMADEYAQGIRPYVSILTPLVVLDWKWRRQPNGRYVLTYFKYLEDVNGDVKTIREWTPEFINTYVVDDTKEVIHDQYQEINGIGMIPAVICYHKRSSVRGVGISAINDIADVQKFIYNNTSEVDQSITLDSHPSIVTTSDTNLSTGAGSVIRISESLDPALKPYVLDFSGANISNIYQSISHCVEQIEKMATIGSVRATEARVLSGVAMETEFQLLNARLSDMASNLENTEEQLWRLFCIYQGVSDYNLTIKYPDSFAIRDTSRELDELQKAKQIATDPRILAAIDEKLAELMNITIAQSAPVNANSTTSITFDTMSNVEDYRVAE